MEREPHTLLEAVKFFANFEHCRTFMMDLRWPDGKVTCPTCGSGHVVWLVNARVWKCYGKHPKAKFSLKTGTIFEDSPLGLDKWLAAVWLVVNCKNGISSYEMARDLGVTQKSAWFMNHRIRLALHAGSFDKMIGTVEADETYIGGKARNMHASKRKALNMKPGRSLAAKVAEMALLQRNAPDAPAQVRTHVPHTLRRKHVQSVVREHVECGSNVHTDAFSSYTGLIADFAHKVIDHAECYVDGAVHTNGCENFWSLLKRGLNGTYVRRTVPPVPVSRRAGVPVQQSEGHDRLRSVSARNIADRRTPPDVLGINRQDVKCDVS